jgi:hypothetical protein
MNDILELLDNEQLDKNLIKSKLESFINTVKLQYENENSKLKKELDNKNAEVNDIKTALGIDKETILNTELIKAKMTNSKDISKVEDKYNEIITNLNIKFEQEKQEILNKLEEEKKKAKELNLQNKISSIIPNIEPQEGALEDIIELLKKDADFNNLGEIVYKQGDTIRRNEKGFEFSLNDRLQELQNLKPYLFKPKVEQGSSIGVNTSSFNIKTTSVFEQRMLDRKRQLGL